MPKEDQPAPPGGEQMDLPELGRADRRLPLEAWERLVTRLELRSHGSAERSRVEGAPRVYWLHGTYQQLIQSPKRVPACPVFRASRVECAPRTNPIFGEMVAAWSLCGRDLPPEGDLFYALCTQTKRCIGWGRVALYDGQVIALLNKGRSGDFLPYAKDAYGLILVFCWPRERDF